MRRMLASMSGSQPDVLVASEQLVTWRHAVQVQSLRILTDGAMGYTGPFTRQVDVYLFALSLRNVIRAAQMVRAALDPGPASQAATALAAFDAAVPRAADVRDVLEHFDAYLSGSGKLQKQAGSRSAVTIWHETQAHAHILRLGVAPGLVLSIDVATASDEARDLATRLQTLVQHQRDTESMRRIADIDRAQRAAESIGRSAPERRDDTA